MSKFPTGQFIDFMNSLRINTKERGIIKLAPNLMGTQKWIMREIIKGLEEGVHEFVILKARQMGISTFSLALDLFWLGRHRGLNGALVTHDEPSRDEFRSTLEMYYAGLPDKWKFPTKQHNRNQWVFRHGTKLLYRVAGTRESGGGKLGRGAALSFMHATEMSSWGDAEGFSSLRNSLAQTNENRLYLWESTARGFNEFYKMCQRSKRAAGQRFIFVPWPLHDNYRLARGSALYNVYWGHGGILSPEEKYYTEEMQELYGVDATDEHWAWYRYWHAEQQPDPLMMAQEFPSTEEQAFIASGTNFFSPEKVTELTKQVMHAPEPLYYRAVLGDEPHHTRFVECNAEQANLKMWSPPQTDAVYAMGADPAYGSSENANNFAIEIVRCYSDKVVQVAEFCDPAINTKQFAWVMAALTGAFHPCTLNLEVNGPGQAVLNELNNLKRMQHNGSAEQRQFLTQAVSKLTQFMYKKYDSLSGTPQALHTVSNFQMKERYFSLFRDYFESGMVHIDSESLAEEMKSIVREGGAAPAASNDGNDDLCVAMSLAILAWNDQLRTSLMIKNRSYVNVESEEQKKEQGAPSADLAASRVVQGYLARIGFGEDERKKRVPGVSWSIPKTNERPP